MPPTPDLAHDAAPARCSLISRGHGEIMAGTAQRASRWLLVEHPGPWARQALSSPPLDGPVGSRLAQTAAAYDAQVVLVRRPGDHRPPGVRRWFVVDHPSGTAVGGEWTEVDDLGAAAEALASGAEHPDARPLGRADLILICTHGKRDVCCAQLARPVVTDLAARWPDRVWESSHLGGHRFAPTALMLPECVQYGRLDPAVAAGVVERHLAGEVDPAYLRGMTYLAPPAQAALAAVVRHTGPGFVGTELTVTDGADGWSVAVTGRVDGAVRTHQVVVRTEPGAPAIQSCSAEVAEAPAQYVALVAQSGA